MLLDSKAGYNKVNNLHRHTSRYRVCVYYRYVGQCLFLKKSFVSLNRLAWKLRVKSMKNVLLRQIRRKTVIAV